MASGSLYCGLCWPCKSSVTPAWPTGRLLRRGAEKWQEKGFMCSSWVKRILLNCGFDGKHYVRLVQTFPEVCQQPQKWSLIENSWRGGWHPASPRFSMPRAVSLHGQSSAPGFCQGPGSLSWGCSGSTQVQTPAQRLKPVKPERGVGQDYQLLSHSGLGVNHWRASLQDELTNVRFSGQGCGGVRCLLGEWWMDYIVLWSPFSGPAGHQLGSEDTVQSSYSEASPPLLCRTFHEECFQLCYSHSPFGLFLAGHQPCRFQLDFLTDSIACHPFSLPFWANF